MRSARPTLSELRAVVQKPRHREIGNWLARRVGRPSAVYGTWLAVRLGGSAHQITFAALVVGLAGAGALATGDRLGFVAAAALGHLAFWLDHVDGQVARWRETASLDGVYYDYMMHHVVNMAVGFALGFGLAVRTGRIEWAAVGFAIALGWTVLSLHNDCRYKAFFERLKSASGSYRINGGAGGRPAPAPGWPRRGLGVLSYPAQKACEPHVVLLCLTAGALLALLSPWVWEWCWRAYAGAMAVGAPLLGAARIQRAVARRATEAEFQAWFQLMDRGPVHGENGARVSRASLDTAIQEVV